MELKEINNLYFDNEIADLRTRFESAQIDFDPVFQDSIRQAEHESGIKKPLAWQILAIVVGLLEAYLEQQDAKKPLSVWGKITLVVTKIFRLIKF